MANEVLDIQDLAEGAEVQRRMFNRMTPPGFSWLQPMSPAVVPFDAKNFDEKFLAEFLGEDKNSVAIYPLLLALDPETRETLVFNADGKLIAAILTDQVFREWPEDADPSRVTLQLALLPSEDVEPYLYTESRIAEYEEARTAKTKKTGGMVLRSLGASEFGIAGIQYLTNGSMRITVTNGADAAEVFAYTVWHTSSVSVVVWTNEFDEVVTNSHTAWHPASPPFDGIESAWECLTTNLVLTNGVGIFEDATIPTNARVRFYAVANRLDSDGDGLTDGAEIFIHRTDPGNPDTDGDGWSDAEELAEETDPLDRFSATKLARGVVLNEVLYDASGTDLGKEWIELYSAGRYPVDVGGFVIQVADTAYTNAYVFPSNTWIDPGRLLLLGGELVTNRDLEVDFTMPNRFTNDATAAVRLAAVVGTNTVVADCLMYGGNAANFNPHGLDPTGWISSNALSAGAGRSLYRRFAGHDTDQVQDWQYTISPTPNSSADIPDSDGDGLADQEELTGSLNPYGEPTDRHNADSDGDGLSDYAECITHGTNPNTWATDGDIFPWPPPSGAVSNWWGSDSYEIANGWNPLVFDENANGIPDSWEMAFPGTNLYADADGDGISNCDELAQNSDPNDIHSTTAQPYVIRYESSMPGWVNDGMTDIGLEGWVKTYFEGLKADMDLCVWVKEGRTQEEFRVVWRGATQKGIHWLSDQEVVTSAGAGADTRPYLFVQDLGMHPNYTNTLGGEYKMVILSVDFKRDGDCSGFDDTLTPPWIMVPKTGDNTAIAEIDPAAIANQVGFVSADTSKATVAPATASASPQTITVSGVAKGDTEIQAKPSGSSAACATLKASVKERINKTIKIHAITEGNDDVQVIPVGQGQPNQTCITAGTDGVLNTTAVGDDTVSGDTITTGPNGICNTTASGDDVQVIIVGHGKANATCVSKGANGFRDSTPSGDDAVSGDDIHSGADGVCNTTASSVNVVPVNVPTAAGLQSYLNDTIWGRQANVYFTVTRSDETVNFDLDRDGKLDDPYGGPPGTPKSPPQWDEVNAVRTVRDTSVDYNIYYVSSYGYPIGLTVSPEVFTQGTAPGCNSVENHTAHEVGHLLGRSGESSDVLDVMYQAGLPSNPCRVLKYDWDAVNP